MERGVHALRGAPPEELIARLKAVVAHENRCAASEPAQAG